MYLSVIIPSYNEEKRIAKTLLAVDDFLRRQNYEYEILVVNDGSKDKTAEVVGSLKEQVKNLKLIDEKINHGKGWVVRRGMLEAHGEFRLFMDADNSTTIDQVINFLPYFNSGYDIVIGSRRMTGAVIAVHQPWIRDFLGGIFRFIVHMLVPLGVTDSQAGFKVFSQKAAEAVFKKQTIFRWAFDVEILAIARLLGFKVKEVPIHWVNDTESHVKLSGMIKMLLEVWRVRINLWRGKYDN
ncbi:MAG: Glycosyltransferases involved in cell wall bioproteini [Parcubacteria group bacterium Gr01-1014_44]|nr:MAG: Glycosyltransferases involved in cell wall bioproteini [Parcubacteria group bacterium Gr01-1014_44]